MAKVTAATDKASGAPTLIAAVHQLHQALDGAISKELGDAGITPRQVLVLQAIDQAKGGSQTDIVRTTGIDRSTVAVMIKRLLKRGLISRRRTKDDARAYAVMLSAEGQKVLGRASKAAAKVEDEAQKSAGPKVVRDLLRLAAALRG